MRLALTRDISPALVRCELTHLEREPIDLEIARRQHDAYEHQLKIAGCAVVRLAAEDGMADSVFIEDTAVVFDVECLWVQGPLTPPTPTPVQGGGEQGPPAPSRPVREPWTWCPMPMQARPSATCEPAASTAC